MKAIRIGNDITIRATVTRRGQEEDFTGKTLRLILRSAYERRELTFTVSGNTLTALFPGAEQEKTGTYTVTLIEDYGDSSRNTADCCPAFRLASCSCDDADILTGAQTLDLTLDITVPASGLSAYELALLHGYEGTEEEWVDSLNAVPSAELEELEKAVKTNKSNIASVSSRTSSLAEYIKEVEDCKTVEDSFELLAGDLPVSGASPKSRIFFYLAQNGLVTDSGSVVQSGIVQQHIYKDNTTENEIIWQYMACEGKTGKAYRRKIIADLVEREVKSVGDWEELYSTEAIEADIAALQEAHTDLESNVKANYSSIEELQERCKTLGMRDNSILAAMSDSEAAIKSDIAALQEAVAPLTRYTDIGTFLSTSEAWASASEQAKNYATIDTIRYSWDDGNDTIKGSGIITQHYYRDADTNGVYVWQCIPCEGRTGKAYKRRIIVSDAGEITETGSWEEM